MLPSFHDHYIRGYSVDCESRRIQIQIGSTDSRGVEERKLILEGVEGYNFVGDAFGNIILDVEEVTAEQLLSEYRDEIVEMYRMSGAPGPWASDMPSAPAVLAEKGVRGLIFYSSLGLSGWVLAKEASVILAQQGAPPDHPTATQSAGG